MNDRRCRMYRLDPLKGKPRPVVEENHGQSVVHTKHQQKAENIDTPKETFGEGPSFTGQLQLPKESKGDLSQDGDNPDHDVRQEWCLGKQGSCGQVRPGRRRRS